MLLISNCPRACGINHPITNLIHLDGAFLLFWGSGIEGGEGVGESGSFNFENWRVITRPGIFPFDN